MNAHTCVSSLARCALYNLIGQHRCVTIWLVNTVTSRLLLTAGPVMMKSWQELRWDSLNKNTYIKCNTPLALKNILRYKHFFERSVRYTFKKSFGNKVLWVQLKRSVGYTFKRSVGYKKKCTQRTFFFWKLYPMDFFFWKIVPNGLCTQRTFCKCTQWTYWKCTQWTFFSNK